ncbi:CNBD2-like protein [Mya arenaria]|uniref:CNBD2-like protein n=1 Tax=Mya arenaria TaxID=6604 RepID=A0ABY7FX95_MYAAR|nr:CNBD2-like protein [Mya arenaria]
MSRVAITSPQQRQRNRSAAGLRSRETETGSRPVSNESGAQSTSRRNSLVARLAAGTPPLNQHRRRSSVFGPRGDSPTDGEREKEGEEDAPEVASRYSSKVSRFMDYYNEALRRRLIKELERPVAKVVPKVEVEEAPHDDGNTAGSQLAAFAKAARGRDNAVQNIRRQRQRQQMERQEEQRMLRRQEMRISEETKKILATRMQDRTEQEIYTAQIALRNIKSFAELPVRMQKMVAAAGHYESYESKRVITREGHFPAAFYFLLSGAVVAMKKDPDRDIASVVEHYSKGDTFEESPLLHDTVREVTVLTKEPCEFLSISSSDYRDIYMQGGVKNLNDPDQESFFKSLSFLHSWPIKVLQDHPQECRFHYFRRGAILSENTQKTPWLIIVKSGSLSVMKKLKKVGPFEWRKKSDIKPLTEKERRDRKNAKEQWRRYVLPELKLPLRARADVEEVEERVDGRPKAFTHPDIKVHLEEERKGGKYYYPNLWTFSRADKEEHEHDTAFSNINKQFLYIMSSTGQRKIDNSKGAAGQKKGTTSDIQPPATAPAPITRSMSALPPDVTVEARSRPDSSISLRSILSPEASEASLQTTSSVFSERLKRLAAENYYETLSESDLNPQFVQIQTLIKGDVWLCPYPSDDSLQESLQVSVDWDAHRKYELTDTVSHVRSGRLDRDRPMSQNIYT